MYSVLKDHITDFHEAKIIRHISRGGGCNLYYLLLKVRKLNMIIYIKYYVLKNKKKLRPKFYFILFILFFLHHRRSLLWNKKKK